MKLNAAPTGAYESATAARVAASVRFRLRCPELGLLRLMICLVFVAGVSSGASGQTVIYVRANAPAGGTGQGWGSAYRHLQEGLAAAYPVAAGGTNVQIWLGPGIYRPDESPAFPNGTDAQGAAFVLRDRISLMGGFAGNETAANQRSPLPLDSADDPTRATILSGDLRENDGPVSQGFANFGENTSSLLVAAAELTRSVRLDGLTITAARATALVCSDSNPGPLVSNCVFYRNDGGAGGGSRGTAQYVNCSFVGNQAIYGGGSYAASGSGTASFVNCMFSGNRVSGATDGGGALSFGNTPGSLVDHCTFINNSSACCGGAIWTTSTGLSITNSVLAANTGMNNGNLLYQNAGGHSFMRYNAVLDLPGAFGGQAQGIDRDYPSPTEVRLTSIVLADPDGADNLAGTLDDDLRLGPGSPMIDRADDSRDTDFAMPGVQPQPLGDLQQRFRRAGTFSPMVSDMGAYEFGSSAIPRQLFVRAGAAPGGDGFSWNTAFENLSDAVAAAPGLSEYINSIWITAGTFRPSPPLGMGGSRSASFQFESNLAIIGGFVGGETAISQRPPPPVTALQALDPARSTLLSGDLSSNDTLDPSRNDNSYHVVTTSVDVNQSCVLDGVTITGGNANGGPSVGGGGLLVLAGGTPVFRNVFFTRNTAQQGGAVHSTAGSRPIFTACRFVSNSTSARVDDQEWGGAYYAFSSSPLFGGCYFEENSVDNSGSAFGGGGAFIAIQDCNPLFYDCSFVRNRSPALSGGAIAFTLRCQPYLVSCTIAGTTSSGAAVLSNTDSILNVQNCVLVGNRDTDRGGSAIRFGGTNSRGMIANSAIVFNLGTVPTVGAVDFASSAGAPSSIVNSLLLGNRAGAETGQSAQVTVQGGSLTISHCSIQGWNGSLGDTTNNDLDPRFLRQPSSGADTVWGTPDDDYGDLSLTNGSPAIDSGDSFAVPADVLDIDGDGDNTESLPRDSVGNARFVDAPLVSDSGQGSPPVDRGAIEYSPPTCPSIGERLWVSPLGGVFASDDNWFPCVPTSQSTVLFDLPSAYPVVFPQSANIENRSAVVRRGDASFTLNSSTYRLTTTQTTALVVGQDLAQNASLTIPDGVVIAASATIGNLPGSIGTISVSNSLNLPGLGSRLAVTNGRLSVGGEGAGNLTIAAGGVVVSRDAFVGEQAGSFGRVIIEGMSGESTPRPSRWTNIFGMTIDHGHVTVRNGGLLQSDTIYLQQGGILDGNGAVQAVRLVNFGEIDPGNSPGTLTIHGRYEQFGNVPKLGAASGRLNLEVLGHAPGEYDKLVVTGGARLGGGLFITGPGAVQLPDTDSIDIVQVTGTIEGQFDVAFMPGRADGKFLRVTYPRGGTVSLGVEQLGGEFSPQDPQGFDSPRSPVAAVSADIDGVNGPDLVVALPAGEVNNGSVMVLKNAGVDASGNWMGFEVGVQYPVGRMPVSVAVGKFVAGSQGDIAVANSMDGAVTVLLNDGAGNFSPHTQVLAASMPMHVSASDFNRDGLSDLVVVDAAQDQVVVGMNTGGMPPVISPRPPIPVGDFPIDDFPTDDDDDKTADYLAVVNSVGGSVTIIPHEGNGVFGQPFTIPVGEQPVRVISTRLNGSPYKSLVTANRAGGTVSVLVGLGRDVLGQPSFAPAVDLPVGTYPTSIAAIDVDIDGDQDLAVSAIDPASGGRAVRVLRNDINGGAQLTFAPAELLQNNAECPIVVLGVNVNGDNRTDVITLNGSDDCGRGLFDDIVVRLNAPPCPADFNRDGGVSSQDFFDFLAAFFSTLITADVNEDGQVNSQDFFDFLASFFTGC